MKTGSQSNHSGMEITLLPPPLLYIPLSLNRTIVEWKRVGGDGEDLLKDILCRSQSNHSGMEISRTKTANIRCLNSTSQSNYSGMEIREHDNLPCKWGESQSNHCGMEIISPTISKSVPQVSIEPLWNGNVAPNATKVPSG